jgi:hypothetical protein
MCLDNRTIHRFAIIQFALLHYVCFIILRVMTLNSLGLTGYDVRVDYLIMISVT